MAFDQSTRNRLQKLVSDCRKLLSEEFSIQLQQTYGIDPHSGEVAGLDRLTHLSDQDRQTAQLLRDTLAHYLAVDADDKAHRIAVIDRIIREQAFTVLNRLAALLMMEARGLLAAAVVSQGQQSQAFELYKMVCGSSLGETGEAYRTFLFSLFDEFAIDLPALFDRYAAQGRLFPREPALLEVLNALNHHEIQPLWAEDETIGWIYQYFNSKEERKAMRDASQAPRNSRELAVRNQFFTPRYVVEFLVDNTLGRMWFNATGGQTALREQCHYLLVKPDEQPQASVRLRDPRTLKLLDPACGSMHFGLYAFDLFLQLYQEAWDWEQAHGPGSLDVSTQPNAGLLPLCQTYADRDAYQRDVPRLVVEHNIYGVDIDPRAAQIASLALWLRAQRAWHDAGVKAQQRPDVGRGNVVAAVAPPAERELRQQFAVNLDPLDAVLFERTLQLLKGLPEMGVLLQVERDLTSLIRQVYVGAGSGLFAAEEHDTWDKAEARLSSALVDFAQAANSSYQGRLFAQDALETLRFIDLSREIFDVVVMNPPFGQATKGLQSYYKKNYPETSSEELAATFFSRSIMLLRDGGFIGEISSRTFFYLYSLKDWRKNVLFSQAPLTIFVDIGAGELDDAVNETAIYVARKGASSADNCHFGMFHREPDKAAALRKLSLSKYEGKVFIRPLSDFEALDDRPLCYWASPSFIGNLKSFKDFGENTADVQMGLAPRDEFRYSRLWWEVNSSDVGYGYKWVGYAKGGELSPYYSDVELLLNAADEMKEIKADLNSKYPYLNGNLDWVLHPENWYFKPGLTFGQRTTFLRVSSLPAGCYFSVAGKAIFGLSQSNESLLQSINTPSAQYLISLRRERLQIDPQFQEGVVSRMPWPDFDENKLGVLERLGLQNSKLVSSVFSYDETAHGFSGRIDESGYIESISIAVDSIRAGEAEADAVMSEMLGLSDMDRNYIDSEILPRWYSRSIANWYSYARGVDEISYVVGVIFGRWDARIQLGAKKPERLLDPFQSLPRYSPAMLKEKIGDAEGEMSSPSFSYPISVAWCGIVEEFEDSPHGLVSKITNLSNIFWEEGWVSDLLMSGHLVSSKDIKDYIGRPGGFFADHLQRYSKNGRRAPIYWPITTVSGAYTLWLYYPALNDQTIFNAINDFVDPRLNDVRRELRLLHEKGLSRTKHDEKRLEMLASLEHELSDFRDNLLEIAPNYRPNHDDGVQITAAPLWKLFRHKPWQKVLKDTWAKLEKGDYDWAQMAMNYWPNRVRDKCVTDKSLAIAHGLEHLYVEPEPVEKKTRGRKKAGSTE